MVFEVRKSIPYWRLYWFGHWYDIFWISISTGVSFWIYYYYIYITNNKCEFWDYCYLKKNIYILIVYINYMFINLII